MDEKLKKELLEIYDSLSDEQREKAKECKTMEEVSDFAAEEGIELPDEMLDDVAGGYLYRNHDDLRWEVIDDKTGDVRGSFYFKSNAEDNAKELGQSKKEISWDQLDRLRKTGSIKKC